MDVRDRRSEVGAFLKARRAAITPEAVGLPRGERRRATGLKREEVAFLAGVGLTWYTWIEQGRDITVSPSALGRIARALRLSDDEKSYLRAISGQGAAPSPAGKLDTVLASRLQTIIDLYQAPAFVIDSHFDVLIFNDLAEALYDFDNGHAPFVRNHYWNAFMNPARQSIFVDWKGVINRAAVGAFRVDYANSPGDARFEELLCALLDGSEEFAAFWAEQHTARLTPRLTRAFHRDFGRFQVHTQRFSIEGASNHMLMVLGPADTETAAIFARVTKQRANRGSRSPAAAP